MAATQDIETVGSGANKVKAVLALALVVAAVAGFYLLARQGSYAQWGALVAGLVLAAGVFLLSDYGKSLIHLFQDSWREVQKVVWPTRKEALQTTAFVFGFVFIMSLFLWLTDKTLEWLMYSVILGWRS